MSFEFPMTSVKYFPDVAIPGQIADNGPRDVATGIADTALDCGYGVVEGSNGEDSIALPAATGDVANKFAGVTVYNPMVEPKGSANRFAAKDTVSVLKKGRIWVTAQGDMVNKGPVYCVHSGTDAGKFRGDNTTATQVSGARVVKGALAGSMALIEVNIP